MKNAYILGQLLIGLFLSINFSFAQTTLVAGDIAIVAYNADEVGNEDELSFLLLKDITAGTIIRFTDFGWCSDINGFQSANPCGASTGSLSDGALSWTAPAGGLLCGSQVHIVCGGLTLSTSAGTVAGLQGVSNFPGEFMSLAIGGDQIFAFQGTLAAPTLITGIGMNGAWDATLAQCTFTSTQSSFPAALSATTAMNIVPEVDNARYGCTVTNDSPTNLRTAIFNSANWTTNDATPFTQPLACTFSCSACTNPTVPTVTPSIATVCPGGSSTLTISGTLNNATQWAIYTGSCGGTLLGTTAGTTFVVTPGANTTYFVRGEGGCVIPGSCGSTSVNVSTLALTANSQTNIACFGGNTGAANVNTATGGAGGYTYNWTPGNPTGDGTTAVTGLIATTFTCTVTDANLCTATVNFTITQPPAIVLNAASQTNISCFGGSNGAASVSAATGGAGGFTYNWTPGNPTGDGTTSVTGLTATTWTCTTTDANGCTATRNFTITQPSAIVVTPATQTNVSCFGGSNGSASINTPTGGAGGYTYNWTPGNPTGDGTVSVTGLTATTYTCTVTDANSCTATQNFTVTQPSAIVVTPASQTNVSCNGGSNGAAAINTPTGGAGGYTYNWTPGNPTGDGTTSVTGLIATTFTCTVTDANSCTATQNFTITQPSAIVLTSLSQTNVSCFGGSNGAASVNAATGGAGGYTYNWTPGNPTGDGTTSVTGLIATTWTCTATDANGCTATRNFTITQPSAIVVTPATQTNVSCFGGSNGSASINTPTGGAGGYTYNWTPGNPTGDGTTSVTGLTATTYTCTVTDANSCTATQNFTVTQPSAIVVTPASQTNVSCNGGGNGAAAINTPTGGAGGYTYNWTPGNPTGDGTTSVTGLTATTYTCTVTDANSCTATQNFTVTQPSAIVVTPASQTNVSCNGGSNGAATINTPTGGAGGYTFNWTPGNPTGDGTTSVTGLTATTWTCTVTDANSCTATQNFTITQPTAIVVTPSAQTNVSCFGGSNGAASINTPTGGAGGYTYNWTPGNPTGDGTTSVTGLTATTYTCTVTDANSCTATQNFTVTQPTAIVLTIASQTNETCGLLNGAVSVNAANGGSGGFVYDWTPGTPTGDGTTSITGIGAGMWTCTVTDANSCTATANATITNTGGLDNASFNYSAASYCSSDADPTPTITGLAGGSFSSTPGLSINASTGVIDVSASTPATYTVTYLTAGPCPNSTMVSVTINGLDNASFSYSATAYCLGQADPTPTITGLAGGTFSSSPAGLTLNPVTGFVNIGASLPNTYTITYTTAGACPNSSNVSLTISIPPSSPSVLTPITVCPGANVILTATGSGTGSMLFYNSVPALIGTVAMPPATATFNAGGFAAGMYTFGAAESNGACQSLPTMITVNVSDVTAPTAVCQNATIYLDGAGSATLAPSLLDGGSTDNCGSITFGASQTLFSCSDISISPISVTLTVTDASSNFSTCVANVTVLDTISPIADLVILADVTAECSVSSLTTPTATDNCGGVVTITNNASLPITAQGTTIVTWTYTDPSGNASTQTQNVIVDDVTAPVPNVATLADVTAECSVSSLTTPTATDNCGGVVTITNNATLPITTQGTTVVTWTYNDGNGNTSTQTQNVIIDDVTAPVPNLATLANVTAECSVTSLTAPTATDNCGGVVTVTNNATLPITAQGTVVVTWTYNDGNGNTSTQTQNVIVDDITAPVPNVATLTNVTAECSVTSLTAPSATDNCGGVVTVTNNATLPITSQGTTVVTWTYNDGNGNTSTQTQNVIIDDVTAPVPNLATLANVTAECSVTSLTAPTATDNCGGVVMVTNNATLPITAQGTTVVTWTYDDGNGNTSTQTQNVIVDDVTAPVPNVATLADVTAECSVTSLTAPTATDNCGGVVAVTNNATLPITAQGTTVVTWTYNDGNGNTSTQTQNVIIDDVTAPVPNLATLANVTAECSVTSLTAPTATDNCGGVVTVTNNATLPITAQGTVVVTWTYSDINGNSSTQTQNVIIDDVTAPVPNVATLANVTAECSVTSLTAPTATDNCGGVVTVTNNAVLPITTQGTSVVTWTYNDGNGNTSTQTQNVIVDDVTAPVPNAATLANVTAECSVSSLTAPTATDNCGGVVTVTNNATLPITTQGTTVVTWTYNDGNGNTSTQTQNVIIDDVTAPVPTLASLANVTAECSVTSLTAPTATDNCGGVVTVTNNATLPITTQGTVVVTWTYDDGNGNTSTQTQNVIIDDVTAPVPNLATLANVTAECSVTSLTAPTATDNCGGVVTVTNNATLPITAQGTVVVTWTYNDGNGNTSTQAQNVIVDDDTAPVPNIATLADVMAECSVTSLTTPAATDNCGGVVTVTNNATLPITTQGTTVVTWTYNDGNGNTSTQTQNVVIDDVTSPVPSLATLANITAECSVSALIPPTATDNCGGAITVTHNATLPITAQGTTVVTWTYNDGNGNTATQTQNVVLLDISAPLVSSALPLVTAECSVSLTAPIANDACVGPITGTTSTVFPITTQGTTVVIWTYNDGLGNTSTQTQIVVVDDITAPVPDVAALADVTATCSISSLTAPSASDNCGGAVTVTNNATLPISVLGTTVVTWTYTDASGNTTNQNQNVILTDVAGPIADVATLPNIVGECSATAVVPTATDACDGITVNGTTSDPLSYSTQGTFTITWTYTDVSGNTTTQTQTVIVADVTGPVPNTATLAPITALCSVTPIAPSGMDNCAGLITAYSNENFPITSSTLVTWIYEDGNGNITTQTQNVTITGVDVSTSISADGVEITANNATGDSYQWIDCSTGDPVADGTNQTYMATSNGSYAVVINENGCIDTSACVTVTTVGIEQLSLEFTIYPNPTLGGSFTVEIDAEIAKIELIDVLGRLVAELEVNNGLVDVSTVELGNYFVKITATDGRELLAPIVVAN